MFSYYIIYIVLNIAKLFAPKIFPKYQSCHDCHDQHPSTPRVSEVHFWLTGLAASRMYYVQVAAKTACGQGQRQQWTASHGKALGNLYRYEPKLSQSSSTVQG